MRPPGHAVGRKHLAALVGHLRSHFGKGLTMLRFLQFAALGFAVLTAVASDDRVITTESPSSGVAFSKDGNSLAVFGEDKKISVWDLASGKLVRNIEMPKDETAPFLLESGRHV